MYVWYIRWKRSLDILLQLYRWIFYDTLQIYILYIYCSVKRDLHQDFTLGIEITTTQGIFKSLVVSNKKVCKYFMENKQRKNSV